MGRLLAQCWQSAECSVIWRNPSSNGTPEQKIVAIFCRDSGRLGCHRFSDRSGYASFPLLRRRSGRLIKTVIWRFLDACSCDLTINV